MSTKKTKKEPMSVNIISSSSLSVTNYFRIGDIVLMGKYKNARGKIIGFGEDKWSNPTVEIEPIPKGRKQNKIIGLFRIWRADVKEKEKEKEKEK